MQSASPRRLQIDLEEIPAEAWRRFREAMSGRVFLLILVLLLTDDVASSTAAFHWVDGIEVVTPLSLLAALLMAALAITPLMDSIALAVGALLAVPVSLLGAWPQIHQHHPKVQPGLEIFNSWSTAAKEGVLVSDTTFFLFLICVLLWISGAWLSWCVMRWRRPLLGLIPGAAALSTNLLNVIPGSTDQNGYTFAMMVLIIALLLWSSYMSAVANAKRTRMKLSGDARWDFWQTGLLAMAGVIVLSIFLPPLSNTDRTVDVESGMFQSWAQLQQDLNHPAAFIGIGGRGGSATTGFSDDVKLIGTLKRNHDIVFTYSMAGEYGGPRYFRGVDESWLTSGEWRYVSGAQAPVEKNQQVVLAERYDALGVAAFTVRMVRPPNNYTTVLFYPGQLFKLDRDANGHEAPLFSPSASGLWSIDRLDSVQPATSAGGYTVTSEYSAATASQLEAAGTDYPAWVESFETLPAGGYRPPQVLNRIRRLAEQVTAGATTPYDKANRIESYLRDPNNFKYTLTPPTPPAGRDPMDFFLFSSHQGYCEYFATAMGDMLRSLGIPSRLVNGYGAGQFDASLNQYVVHSDDAHTWVEVYFPTYGWIPYEPTADGTYSSIPRGQNGGGFVCLHDEGCDAPPDLTSTGQGSTSAPTQAPATKAPAAQSSNGFLKAVAATFNGFMPKLIVLLFALLLVVAAAGARYLRPKTVMAAWKRTLVLADLAGAKARPGETPLELGRRLSRTFPEAAEPVASLTSSFTVAAYAPPETASEARSSVMEAWTNLRPMLLRRVFERLRGGRL